MRRRKLRLAADYHLLVSIAFKFHDWMHVKLVHADYRDMSAPKDSVTLATSKADRIRHRIVHVLLLPHRRILQV
jgi:hypothetical protein